MESKGKAVLVCGGAGYIGSHAVWTLLGLGLKVIVLDNLATGHLKSISEELKSKMFSNLPEEKAQHIQEKLSENLHFRQADMKDYAQMA